MSKLTYQGKMTRQWCEWLIDTCLFFGTTHKTAYIVAGHWAEGIEQDWKPDEADLGNDVASKDVEVA